MTQPCKSLAWTSSNISVVRLLFHPARSAVLFRRRHGITTSSAYIARKNMGYLVRYGTDLFDAAAYLPTYKECTALLAQASGIGCLKIEAKININTTPKFIWVKFVTIWALATARQQQQPMASEGLLAEDWKIVSSSGCYFWACRWTSLPFVTRW